MTALSYVDSWSRLLHLGSPHLHHITTSSGYTDPSYYNSHTLLYTHLNKYLRKSLQISSNIVILLVIPWRGNGICNIVTIIIPKTSFFVQRQHAMLKSFSVIKSFTNKYYITNGTKLCHLSRQKWLIFCCYITLHRQHSRGHRGLVSKALDFNANGRGFESQLGQATQ